MVNIKLSFYLALESYKISPHNFGFGDLIPLTNRSKLARIASRFSLGYRQAVRHLVLVQAFRGSNPFTPATSLNSHVFYNFLALFVKCSVSLTRDRAVR